MNAQIPLPSFGDIRKILQFWIEQQDRWFYFEIGTIQSGSTSEKDLSPQYFYAKHIHRKDIENEALH